MRRWRWSGDIGEIHELRDVVWSAGFQARAKGRFAQATEGLAQDDGARW